MGISVGFENTDTRFAVDINYNGQAKLVAFRDHSTSQYVNYISSSIGDTLFNQFRAT